MPAEVGYSTTVNLAAEIAKPAQQPTSVIELKSRKEDAKQSAPQEQSDLSAADASSNTTADRGRNLNISA